MDLLLPGVGLMFWQFVIFLIVFFVLRALAWKPIMSSLKARDAMIDDSIKSAEIARDEVAQLKADNEYLLQEARAERDKIVNQALATANQIKEEAKAETSKISEKMIQDAKQTIEAEKKAALAEVRDLVGSLSVDIAEKILREKLGDESSQKSLVDKFLKDVKVN